jgi:hypothetical protein
MTKDWKKGVTRDLRKLYYFIFKDDSLLSWVVNVLLAIVLVKFIIYPGLSLILGTSLPLVAVISGSMDHNSMDFDTWWEEHGEWYEEQGITKEMFDSYIFTNGFNKGDVMILTEANNPEVGDVLVYSSLSHPYPVIHRVTYINEEDNLFQFRGDNNPSPDPQLISEDQILGKAVVRVPWIGWIKIWFAVLLEMTGIV